MRSLMLVAALLSLAVAPCASAQAPASKGTGGQCRDATGKFVGCGSRASTDSEGVPLAFKASAIRSASAKQTSRAVSDMPAAATARCRDGGYSVNPRRDRACRHQGGVASWIG